jgi:hypothetical protein
MTAKKHIVRRRKWKRFKVRGGAIVYLSKPRVIKIAKHRLLEMGPVADISMGGVAVQYVEKDIPEAYNLVTIAHPSEGIKIDAFPVEIISDVVIAKLDESKQIRNRCMRFGKLTSYQSFKVEEFIDEYAILFDKDRRASNDRRVYNDPKFEDYEYSVIYEKRLVAERRTVNEKLLKLKK